MKYLLVILFVTLLTFKTAAQTHPPTDSLLGLRMMNAEEPHLPTSEVKNHIGKAVYIYDVVSGSNTVNDTLRLLYVGGKYPKHQVTIQLKGKKVNQESAGIKVGDQMHFSGIAISYDNKPSIVITRSIYFGEQIQL